VNTWEENIDEQWKGKDNACKEKKGRSLKKITQRINEIRDRHSSPLSTEKQDRQMHGGYLHNS
jgi:hypothetical protein